MPQLGKILVFAGLGITLLGLAIWFFGNKFNWFGNLPGDVWYEGKNVRIFAPFMTMLLVSILFSLIMWIIRRFF